MKYQKEQPVLRSNICVLDFETDGPNPKECRPVQLACVMINPYTFEVIEGSEFSTYIKHPYLNNPDYMQNIASTVQWHAEKQNVEPENILEQWRSGMHIKDVIHSLANFMNQYEMNGMPIPAGHNFCAFDDVIMHRYCEECKYINKKGNISFFHPVYKIDTMQLCLTWFGTLKTIPSVSLDVLRGFFNIPLEGSHEALKDVKDTAKILARFLTLQRDLGSRIKFEGALNDEDV